MNKFTRSQMGKIMAYALSAAMAVTVVPTYMKPVTTYAAEVASTQEVSNGEAIDVTVTAATATRFALFEKSTENQTGDKAVYVFDAIKTEGSKTDAELIVPYDVPAGTYYVGAYDTGEVTNSVAASDKTEYTVDKTKLVKINAASAASAIQVSAKDGNTVYFSAKSDDDKLVGATGATINLQTTVISPSKDATYLSVKYEECDKNGNAKDTPSDGVAIAEDTGVITLTQDTAKFGTYYFKATATVAGKNSTTATKEITSTVKIDIVKSTVADAGKSKISIDRSSMLLEDGKEYATVTSNILSASEKNDVTETIKWKIEASDNLTTFTDAGGDSKSEDGIVTYTKDSKVYATYEIATGKFTPKESAAYKITWTGAESSETKSTDELKVYSAKFATDSTSVEVGSSTSKNVGITSNLPNATYSYEIDDPNVATVEQKSAVDTNPSVKAVSAGATKLIATIKYYDGGKELTATRETTIISTVDAENLDLSKVENPEEYVDAVIANADNDVKDVIIDAILDGTIDATKLAPSTIAALDAEANAKFGRYFVESVTGLSNVKANGLVLSAAYEGILDEDAPKDPVEVAVTTSNVRVSDKNECVEGSVANFVAEYTIDGKAEQPNSPIAFTYTASKEIFDTAKKYDIYENGVKIATVKPTDTKNIAFTTSGFSVFSIVEADADTPDEPKDIYDLVNFSAHVQRRIGTDDEADIAATVTDDGLISLGTHGQSRRVEMITLNGLDPDSVEMTAHVQRRVDHPEDVADLTQVVNEDGSISLGTEHQSRRLEAFSMNLKGDLADQYDVYYRVHAQNVGWLGWAKNGELAGTSHKSLRLEEIEIVFVEKGTEFDASQYIEGHEDGDRGYLDSDIAFIDGSVSEK